MNGCLKATVRLAGLALLVLALAVAWWFREPLLRAGSRWFGPQSTALPPVADTAVGAPTPAAVASSGTKLSALKKASGPDSVVLSANEMASLIGGGIDWQVRKTFDSLRVELLDGTFAVHARLDTRAIPPDALGPFAAMLGEREPLRLAGPFVVESPGRGRWILQELSLRGFPFPGPMVQQIARRVAGADSTGALLVPIPPDVAEVKIPTYGRGVVQAEAHMTRRVLVVDDEKGIREALRQLLEYEEFEVRTAASGGEAQKTYAEFHPHLVFLDVKMQGVDGLETLTRLRQADPNALVVMVSGHGSIQTAVEATQLGAYDFLEKPLDTDRVLLTLRNALSHVALATENVRLKAEVHAQHEIVGSSKPVNHLIERIEKVAPTGARVLITGENGTGKELVARAIHALSPRAQGPFVEVNCAAIPSELIESELFGHMKGSFTGAMSDRPGKFEMADGGSLFLDEIGDMSPAAQAKVLRALQEGVISRVGSGQTRPVDVRVIAATNKDLSAEIAAGRFREDLLYRLNVVPIEVPPLRERRGDIRQLVAHFAGELGRRGGLPAREFDESALVRLETHDWPGNIRELRNAVERLLILAAGSSVVGADVDRMGMGMGGGGGSRGTGGGLADAGFLRAGTFEDFKQQAERAFLEAKLAEHDWNVSETARTLQMPRSNLYKKIERYHLARNG